MKYQAVLFDVDGTLVDSFPPYLKIMKSVLKAYHINVTDKQLKRTFSMSLNDAFNYLRIPVNLRDAFERSYFQKKVQHSQTIPVLFPGIVEMFRGLNKTLLPGTGIVTSDGNDEVRSLADHFLFMQHVWTTVTADTLPYHKPAPEPLLTAIDQMGIPASRALYVGDALVDMEAANNAKMDFGIADWGADPKVHFTDYKYRFKRPQDILTLF